MNSKNKRKSKYIIVILMLTFLFFILFNTQTKQKNTNENIVQKVSSKFYQNYQSENILSEKTNENKIQQSTNSEKSVEKEYIETEYKGYKVCAKLNIPTINLETYVLAQYSKEALLTSVTKFYGGEPNEVGNFCIAGHNYGPSNMFQNIKKLKIKDEIFLTDTNGKKLKYLIYDIYTVLPNETYCLSQKTDGNVELTLITCTPDSEKRIIIKAKKI